MPCPTRANCISGWASDEGINWEGGPTPSQAWNALIPAMMPEFQESQLLKLQALSPESEIQKNEGGPFSVKH